MADLSDKQLKIGYWWVSHRAQLKKWWVIILLLIDVLIFLYILFNVVLLVAHWSRDSRIPEKMASLYINFAHYQQQNQPQPVKVSDQLALFQDEKFDVIAKIENPNQKWASENLQYRFKFGGLTSDLMSTFLMPGETRYLFAYGFAPDNTTSSLQVIMEAMNWKRIERPDDLPKLNFEFQDIKPERISLKNSSDYSLRVTATVHNQSIYSLKDVRFQVILKSANRPVGFQETPLKNFESFSERQLEVVWSDGSYPAGVQVEIIPLLNLLDQSNFYTP